MQVPNQKEIENQIRIIGNLINDISNFTLVVTGISIGIITLLISIVISNKEELLELNKAYKLGNIDLISAMRINPLAERINAINSMIKKITINVLAQIILFIIIMYIKYMNLDIKITMHIIALAIITEVFIFLYFSKILIKLLIVHFKSFKGIN